MVLERYGAHLFWGDEDALAAYSEALGCCRRATTASARGS